jgi:hypothetical protein
MSALNLNDFKCTLECELCQTEVIFSSLAAKDLQY